MFSRGTVLKGTGLTNSKDSRHLRPVPFRTVPIILLALTAGPSLCAASPKFPSLEDVPLSLGPGPSFETSPAFQKALAALPGSRELERARIDRLLERVSRSPYNFFRNGGRYTGKRAEAHLKWKYFRNLKTVKTAEDFIEHVASQSKMSGEKYLVELPDKKRIPLRPVLLKELELFDEAVASHREPSPPTRRTAES